jgi:hypothetical protein
MVKAVDEWSACMRDKGFDDLAEPEEVDAQLEEKLVKIVGSPGEAVEPVSYDQDALDALQAEEVRMVAADIACEKEHITKVEEDVRVEEEKTFREQNADLLSKVPPP